jgi:transposase-like protein
VRSFFSPFVFTRSDGVSKIKSRTAARQGREFWLAQLQACERAGQTVRAYAHEQGLNEHTAYTWRKRLRAEGSLGGRTVRRWARVQVVEPAVSASTRYRVQLPNGMAVEFGGAIDEEELGRVLRVVAGR